MRRKKLYIIEISGGDFTTYLVKFLSASKFKFLKELSDESWNEAERIKDERGSVWNSAGCIEVFMPEEFRKQDYYESIKKEIEKEIKIHELMGR